MGTPDYLSFHPDIAREYGLAQQEFQTRQLQCNFVRWSIDQDRKLVKYPTGFKREHGEKVPEGTQVAFHGDLCLTGLNVDGTVFHLVARFVEGGLTSAIPWEMYPETLKELFGNC